MSSIRAPLAVQPLGRLSARNPSSPPPRPLLWSLNLKTRALAECLACLSNEWEGCRGRAREASAARVCSSRCLPDAASMGVAWCRFPGEKTVFTREGVLGLEQGARAWCEIQLPQQPQHRHLPCCKTPLRAKGCLAPACLNHGTRITPCVGTLLGAKGNLQSAGVPKAFPGQLFPAQTSVSEAVVSQPGRREKHSSISTPGSLHRGF